MVSLRSSRRFAISSRLMVVSPVKFLPGGARLSATPITTGSLTLAKTAAVSSRPLHGQDYGRVHGKYDVERQPRQFDREGIEGGLLGAGPPVLDDNILRFDPPVISQPIGECLA